MRLNPLLTLFALLIVLIGSAPGSYAQNCKTLRGKLGSSSQWSSGWIDLPTTTVFKKGERLRLSIGGTAAKVLVRIVLSGESPDDDTGIVGEFSVPASRNVEVILKEDLKSIKQISVHGGPNPWGKYPLGGGNGPATIKSVEHCSP